MNKLKAILSNSKLNNEFEWSLKKNDQEIQNYLVISAETHEDLNATIRKKIKKDWTWKIHH